MLILVRGTYTNYYAYVGGMGKSNKPGNSEGGFNRGGYSGEETLTGKDDGAGGGGGATDLRINYDSINNRIIVAGGGACGAATTYLKNLAIQKTTTQTEQVAEATTQWDSQEVAAAAVIWVAVVVNGAT